MMMLQKKQIGKNALYTVALMLVLLASGCATKPDAGAMNLEPPMHTVEKFVDPNVEYAVDVYDPLEGFNRNMYTFNYYFDEYFFLPVVGGYQYVMPDYAEERVSDFVDNVFEFNNFVNNLLQFKVKETGLTVLRFVVNTTVGIAGLWDPATDIGLTRQSEDFGQTLGHYGVGDGPYLVLPVFGPSNFRDTTGLITDTVSFNLLGPPAWLDNDDATLIFTGVSAVDNRKRESFRYYETGSPFEYEMIRMLYTAKRKIEISK